MKPSLKELVSAYADGELTGCAKKRVQEEIRRNPEVSQFYQSIIMIKSEIAKLPRFQLPSHFNEVMMNQIQTPNEEKKSPLVPLLSEENVSDQAPVKESLFLRLTNPRIWFYPFLALIVCLLIPVLRKDSDPSPSSSDTSAAHSAVSNAAPQILLRLKTSSDEKTLRELNLFLDAWTSQNGAEFTLIPNEQESFFHLALPVSALNAFLDALPQTGFSINRLPQNDSSAPLEIEIAQKTD